jgi:hypothetical protein
MALGRKTGGRLFGTPNRRTIDIQTLLIKLGCDPIEGMARIAMDCHNPVELRARMFAELAHYIAPKRKAIQIDGSDASPVIFNIAIPPRKVDTLPNGGATSFLG